MDKIIVKPKPGDLLITGQFLGIEVHFTSFTVLSQLYFEKDYPISYEVRRVVFPICFLEKFFRVNGQKGTMKYWCERPEYLKDITEVGGEKGVSL